MPINSAISVDITILGCIDAGAANYNSLATVDDGSCEYVLGCTDNIAENYGGGMLLEYSNPTLTHVTIANNIADDSVLDKLFGYYRMMDPNKGGRRLAGDIGQLLEVGEAGLISDITLVKLTDPPVSGSPSPDGSPSPVGGSPSPAGKHGNRWPNSRCRRCTAKCASASSSPTAWPPQRSGGETAACRLRRTSGSSTPGG